MTEQPVMARMLQKSLIEPEIREFLARPLVKSIEVKLEFKREAAEQMFKTLVFEPDEETVTITEVLRPIQPGEPSVFFHTGAGVAFCVDHYELDGVRL